MDENKSLDKITNDIKIKSLVLEIKFICLNKILIENLTNKFKNNNLKISNLYCTSYVKIYSYKKQLLSKDYLFFIDIGFTILQVEVSGKSTNLSQSISLRVCDDSACPDGSRNCPLCEASEVGDGRCRVCFNVK